MRFADNFNPEWGYLAPAPSFLRTARVALVAAAIGATSGAGVVFSLMDRPAADESSIAARTLVRPNDAAFVVTSPASQLQMPHDVGTPTVHVGRASSATVAASEAGPNSAIESLAVAQALVEASVAPTPPASEAAVAGDTAPPQKKAFKKQSFPQPRLAARAPREQPYGAAHEPALGNGRTPLALLPNGGDPTRSSYSSAYQVQDNF